MKSRNSSRTASQSGAASTSACEMPVSETMNSGNLTRGFTSEWKTPNCSSPRNLTAPTSMIRSDLASKPVVSKSSATNVSMRGDTLLAI